MSLAAATTLSQVLPALLVVGLLGPLLVGWRVESPERYLFAFQTLLVVAVEGVLLWYVIRDQRMPDGWAVFVQLAILWALVGIAIFVLAWAKRSPAERAAERSARQQKSIDKQRDRDNDPPKSMS